jgi:hypothetical protein
VPVTHRGSVVRAQAQWVGHACWMRHLCVPSTQPPALPECLMQPRQAGSHMAVIARLCNQLATSLACSKLHTLSRWLTPCSRQPAKELLNYA